MYYVLIIWMTVLTNNNGIATTSERIFYHDKSLCEATVKSVVASDKTHSIAAMCITTDTE